jgi:hypothetical protein
MLQDPVIADSERDTQRSSGARRSRGAAQLQVVFSLAARRKLRQRATRDLAKNPHAIEHTMSEIEDKLQAVFPPGSVAVVQELYAGYRPRDGEHILLVEVSNSPEKEGAYVVKLGPPDRLRRELDGWKACQLDRLRHDLVLTTLEPRLFPDSNRLVALIYEDAEQFIGVDQTLSLEAALLDGTRLGVPTPQSAADVLFQLYERLGLILYRNCYADDPASPAVPLSPERLDERLGENLTEWSAQSGPAFDTKAVAISAADDAGLTEVFLDPYRFGKAVHAAPGDWTPCLLRGYAHGDLHGRNVLVGRVGDRVLWPAVFDYGDMGTDKVIGWDFVKLETEFKVRAYAELLAGKQQAFVTRVIEFERSLHEETELCREDANSWPPAPAGSEPSDRLRWLILMIRKNAANHLGLNCRRSREWLAEYYFLLALYGLNSVRFKNLTALPRLAAYLSAGCAASRYVWDRKRPLSSGGLP